MRWIDLLGRRMRALTRSSAVDRDLREEMRAHLDQLIQQHIDAGRSPSEARTLALREFGGVAAIVDDSRDVRGVEWVHRGLRDHFGEFLLAARRLRKRPGATIVSILTLSCSIGAAIATWSLFSATLLAPLKVRTPERLVIVGMRESTPTAGPRLAMTSILVQWRQVVRDSNVFDGTATYGLWTSPVTTPTDESSRALAFVSPSFFDLLGVSLSMGRWPNNPDDAPAAVISDRFYRTVFGANPSAIGQRFTIGAQSVQVVGVVARGFSGLDLSQPVDIFLPSTVAETVAGPVASMMSWRVIGRVRPNESAEIAETRLNAATADSKYWRLSLIPIELAALPEVTRPAMTKFARLLLIAVGLLLAVGCLTVGMLVLLRTEARRMEFATCLALGANRGRLVQGVVIEGSILAIAGAILSLPTAAVFLAALRTSELPGRIPIDGLDLSINGTAVVAAIAGAVFATVVVAAIAALIGVSVSTTAELRPGTGSTPPLKHRLARPLLLIGQVAVSLVLLCGATLFVRSLSSALHVNPGFDTKNLVTGSIQVGAYRFTPQQATPYFVALRDRLAEAATVKSVSLPLWTGSMSTSGFLKINGIERHFPSAVAEKMVDENYFPTIRLPILAGRNFLATDDTRAPLVTIVSESFGRMISNGGNAVGNRIKSFHGKAGAAFPELTIIGVVPDVIDNVAELQPLAMYTPVAQQFSPPGWSRQVFLRPVGDVETAERDVTAIVKSLDPMLKPSPVVSLLTLDEQISRQMGPQRLGARVLGWLGVTALFLTLLGAYVLAESMASARRREMGVRAALGATRRQLGSVILIETVRLAGAGIAVGLLLAWIEAATVRALLVRVSPMDPFALAAPGALILILAIVVSLRPAITAAQVDLASLLREQ